MTSNQVDAHLKEVNQLQTQFEQIRQEVIVKLEECGNCIESAERLNQEARALVRNLEDSLSNASNDAKEWQQIKVKLASTSMKGRVVLDVGGERHVTSVETLTHEKNTFFTAMFSRQWELERNPDDKSVFIDRDGKLFTHILAYLRTDAVSDEIMANDTLRKKLIMEAKYFHLHNLLEILTEPERKEAERMKMFFNNGTLVSEESKKKLLEFLGDIYKKSELLYKASRDGFDANAFHNKCNNKGATITIIQSKDGHLFGGYTSKPWTSNGSYAADPNAFLFTLTNPNNIPPTKYLVKPSDSSTVYHNSGYGPTFGGGHDLYMVANSNGSNSSVGFPSSYVDTTGRGNATFTGSNSFITTDIEIYNLI